MRLERGTGEIAELEVAHLRARGADDLQIGLEQPVGVQGAQRGQQHALCEVAGRAEQEQGIRLGIHPRTAFPDPPFMLHCDGVMSKVKPVW